MSPFLQAEQPQLPQSFLTGFVFQTPHQPCCSPLHMLKCLKVLPKLAQNWTQHLRCGLTSAKHRGRMTSLLLLATFFLIQARGHWPPWPPGHTAGCQPVPQGPFLPGPCPAPPSPAYNTAGAYGGQNAGLTTWIYSTSFYWTLPTHPILPGLSAEPSYLPTD